jgi:two-component system chemotaxis response regulator CheY
MSFNVLIVDDSLSMRSIIKKTIQISGFDVGQYFESSNGQEALEILNDAWIDVIVSDIHMPVMDGLNLLKALQNHDLLKTIPVLMVTTEGRGSKVEEALSLGAKAYVQKPFTPQQIKEMLLSVIGANSVVNDQADSEVCDF